MYGCLAEELFRVNVRFPDNGKDDTQGKHGMTGYRDEPPGLRMEQVIMGTGLPDRSEPECCKDPDQFSG
jgi:hypothetical protein